MRFKSKAGRVSELETRFIVGLYCDLKLETWNLKRFSFYPNLPVM
jgi:hypothetical protein